MSIAIREKLAPVLDWYQSDEHPGRNTADIVADVVKDLQTDRAAVLAVQRVALDAKRQCEAGAPISAYNLANDIISALRGRK